MLPRPPRWLPLAQLSSASRRHWAEEQGTGRHADGIQHQGHDCGSNSAGQACSECRESDSTLLPSVPLSVPLSLCPFRLSACVLWLASLALVSLLSAITCLTKLPALSALSLKYQHGVSSLIQPRLMQWVLHLHSIIEEMEAETM